MRLERYKYGQVTSDKDCQTDREHCKTQCQIALVKFLLNAAHVRLILQQADKIKESVQSIRPTPTCMNWMAQALSPLLILVLSSGLC
jgi:hypothetical protein